MTKEDIIKLIDESGLCIDIFRLECGYIDSRDLQDLFADFILDLIVESIQRGKYALYK